jgi:hypothetical protein
MYKIEAIIHKQGSLPVKWQRFNARPMTLKECLAMLSINQSKQRPAPPMPKIEIKEFSCQKCT